MHEASRALDLQSRLEDMHPDSNKDGKIEEHEQKIWDLLLHSDANRDGYLDVPEMACRSPP